ncbi:hypothetical protein OGATHE_006060 [Ogataea polymorpha]|uniref:Uncharacterized protein n=1 Tax=Ogataea polymorpha TaxID=460523 RepID=A0A9P8NT69_9ASCO|nr:hypothetical protein OGATHE_006060 [Ogataea polymorpha]
MEVVVAWGLALVRSSSFRFVNFCVTSLRISSSCSKWCSCGSGNSSPASFNASDSFDVVGFPGSVDAFSLFLFIFGASLLLVLSSEGRKDMLTPLGWNCNCNWF